MATAQPFTPYRVELAPHLDRWVMGDRFGTVTGIAPGLTRHHGQTVYRVKLDVSGKTIRVYAVDVVAQ